VIRRTFSLALLLFVVGLAMGLERVQVAHADDGGLVVSIASVDDGEYPVVSVVVNVDHGGLPLLDLSADQIEATEGSSLAVVRSLEPVIDSELPIALVLVIDTSGSVSGELIAEVQAAAIGLVQRLGATDSVAVVSFADQVTIAQTLTTDHDAAIAAIDGLTALGNTALFDAVGAASSLAALANVPRSAVVLLSDGAEYGGFSSATRESSLAGIENGAPFYVIGVSEWVDLAYLEEVAGRSGGRYFAVGSAGEVDGVYTAIDELLRSQYVLMLESSSEAGGGERELTVLVTSGEEVASTSKSYISRQEIAAEPVVESVVEAPIEQPPTVEPAVATRVVTPAEEPGGSSLVLRLAAFGVLLIVAVGIVLLQRRRVTDGSALPPPSTVDRRPLRAVVVERAVREAGYLVPMTVAGVETEVPLGEGPITIGSAEDCRAQVAGCSEVAREHARIWQRDGRPMLHHVADGYETHVNGSIVGWAALNDGDEIAIGPYRFQFVSRLQAEPATPREASA
jgi:von Willebrand factor type A domain-containing protein/FHA domain-containing protein